MLVKDVLSKTTLFFREKGIESARLDSELLIASALKWERMKIFLNYEYPLTEAELTACRELVKRRSSGEPIAYILGHKDFYNHSFMVGPAVLIPRPETEQIVEETVAWLRANGYAVAAKPVLRNKSAIEAEAAERAAAATAAKKAAEVAETEVVYQEGIVEDDDEELEGVFDRSAVAEPAETSTPAAAAPTVAAPAVGARIMDFGTGSGCIGLSILAELESAQLAAIDVSEPALVVARANAEKLGLASRAKFVASDVATLERGRVLALLGGAPDAIVANPPYIAENDPAVQTNVKRFEPNTALFSGADGLGHIRAWSRKAAELLKPRGFVMFEIGHDQGPAASEIFEALRYFHDIQVVKDLSGRDRFVRAIRIEG